MSQSNQTVPLTLWGLIAIISIAIIALIHTYWGETLDLEWGTLRLSRMNQNGIVFIGSSLVQHAIYHDDEFEKIVKTNSHKNFTFFRFSKNGASPNEILELLQKMKYKSYKPNYIFIELEPFMYKKEQNIYVRKLIECQTTLHLFVKHLFSMKRAEANNTMRNKNKTGTIKDLDFSKMVIEPVQLKQKLKGALDSFTKNKTKIIFVQMNRSKQAYIKTIPPNLSHVNSTWIKTFNQSYDYPVWQFSPMDMSYYFDRAHLNPKGRLKFTKWFISRLKDEKAI